MQGAPSTIVLADVTDATHPHTLCTLTGGWVPQLVTQRMITWSATQNPGQAGPSVLATMDMFTGTTTLLTSWQGGLFMDGLHGWSPDMNSMAYVASSAGALSLHLLSGGGDQVVATLGSVPGRGVNPSEDDAYVGFSADSTYFAFVQTFSTSGPQLQVRRTRDGSLAYSQAAGTMATWASTGSRLFFREPQHTTIKVWDPTTGVSQLFGLPQAWIRPRADAGDDSVAYTVRDANGLPHVWVYGHGGREGGQLDPNVRSSPVYLNTGQILLTEEAPCGANCGPGPATQPDGHTFIFNTATLAETASTIDHALGSWPRIGQT
jgi:hypothetical protein